MTDPAAGPRPIDPVDASTEPAVAARPATRTKMTELSGTSDTSAIGGKASGLRWLADNGHRTPAAWVLTGASGDAEALQATIADQVDSRRSYAVRSSANVEDGSTTSYAGQFESVLGVTGIAELAAAAKSVVASADTEGVRNYRENQGDDTPIEMAVIIQEMVNPVASGVAFSKNPLTGLSEIVIEAVAGSGEPLTSGEITPDRWVHRWGDLIQEPADSQVAGTAIESVVTSVPEIAAQFGQPVDLEWVYDGRDIWWVQVRPITGLDDIHIYSRRISKEVMPGIIKPLVWSINVPMVNTAWVELFNEALKEVDIAPEDLAKSFGYRSYFNMTALGEVFAALGMPRESLELLLGLPAGSEQPRFKPTRTTMAKMPRLLVMAIRKARYGKEVEPLVARLEDEYEAFARRDLQAMSDAELLADVEELRRIGVRSASVNIITPLLANIYMALLRKDLSRQGIDLAEVDLTVGGDSATDLDPNPTIDELASRIADLESADQEAILENGYEALPAALQTEFDVFLERFGHFSDSGNDFSVPAWRELPDTVVRMAAARGTATRSTKGRSWSEVEPQVAGWKRPLTRALHRRAVTFAHHRDLVSSMYTFGYGLFRRYFLEIGQRLTERSIIAESEDLMYLSIDEVRAALTTEGPGRRAAELVAERRAEIDQVADLDMPEVIFGDDFVPQPAVESTASLWQGTPTSRGNYLGTARVVNGINDFAKIEDGDVLVIPYSDVGWNPLLAKAGAIVAESGGMLSHSSVIAREYGIPCVVSVNGAMRIPEGAVVNVDGYAGVIRLDDAS